MKGANYQGGMGKFKGATLLLWVFFSLCTILVLKIEARTSSILEKEIEAKLKLLNKPAVKSIKVCKFHNTPLNPINVIRVFEK
jgi:hypothetical protein